jgi:hypothetical protein
MNQVLRKKSPRAPSMALDEAVDRVHRAYDKERLHAAPTDVVAQNLGYKGANSGSALSALASLRYYGLLERPKEGFLAVTKDFEHFKFAPDDRQRRALLISFLTKPQLYAELLDKYESGLPSDATLRYELIQRGFSPPAAEGALAAFRQSVEFVGYMSNDDSPTVPASSNVESRAWAEAAPVDSQAVTNSPVGALPSDALSPNLPMDEGTDQIPVRLPGGRRAWLIIPSPFFAADKNRLKAQIDLLLTQDEEDALSI